MDPLLLNRVIDRLDADTAISPYAEVVLAACEGRDELEAFLTGGAPHARPPAGSLDDAATAASAYLSRVTVEGFRGIGPATTLELTPGPGLTLVVGRNGSGKSSFAEALEVLLTAASYRWEGKGQKAWKEGWKNLHHPTAAVAAEFLLADERGPTTITRTWADDEQQVDNSSLEVESKVFPTGDLSTLGWDTALAMFRPFLTYSELGSLLEEGPSRLYDTLASILGLGDLVDAEKALRDARLDRRKAFDTAKAELEPLLRSLEEMSDERAIRCREALATTAWNLDTVESVVTGTSDDDGQMSRLQLLRELSSLRPPDEADIESAKTELARALDAASDLEGTDAGRAKSVADLLTRAVALHESHADTDCPVCGTKGVLDATWKTQSEAEIGRLREEARAAEQAEAAVNKAMAYARSVCTSPPRVLLDSDQVGIDSRPLRDAWGAWAAGGELEQADALLSHLSSAAGAVTTRSEEIRRQSEAALAELEDQWRPLAQRLAEWTHQARPAAEGFTKIKELKKAEDWIKTVEVDIRDERFGPIAAEVRKTWEVLRDRSNVELARPSLEGTGTRRRVQLTVTVDGVESTALSVMSQGELHAMALSLFLPRASLEESPFRFIVIDDPVQSFDPARVDGLARVLEGVARERQIIVFTHDDRLPESIRRLGIDARIIEVTRRPDSVVDVRPAFDPVTRYFADAKAVVRTDDLPLAVAKRVVPGLCRSGIEAADVEVYRRRHIAGGSTYEQLEAMLEQATTTTLLTSLALFDDVDHGGEVLGEINRRYGRREADAFAAVKSGAHQGYDGDLTDLVLYSATLAKKILETR